jgi:hypothetical protein
MMLKGVTIKSSDWRDASAPGAEVVHRVTSNPRMSHANSNASLSSAKSNPPRKMSLGSSQSSLHRLSSNSSFQQFDLQRLSSSSMASKGSNGLASISAMENAVWDNVGSTKPESLNMFDLKISDPETETSSSNPFLDGTYEKAPRRSSRSRSGLSNLLTLREDLRCSFRDEKNENCSLTRSSSKRSLDEVSVDDEFVVSTFKEKVPKQIDTRYLSMADLDILKHEDAFMYYSIPAVKMAALKGRDVDLQDVHDSRSVKRSSVISFESADLLDGLDFETLDGLNIPSLGEDYYYQANVEGGVGDLFMSYFD